MFDAVLLPYSSEELASAEMLATKERTKIKASFRNDQNTSLLRMSQSNLLGVQCIYIHCVHIYD